MFTKSPTKMAAWRSRNGISAAAEPGGRRGEEECAQGEGEGAGGWQAEQGESGEARAVGEGGSGAAAPVHGAGPAAAAAKTGAGAAGATGSSEGVIVGCRVKSGVFDPDYWSDTDEEF